MTTFPQQDFVQGQVNYAPTSVSQPSHINSHDIINQAGEFLKQYWWVFAILIIVYIWYKNNYTNKKHHKKGSSDASAASSA